MSCYVTDGAVFVPLGYSQTTRGPRESPIIMPPHRDPSPSGLLRFWLFWLCPVLVRVAWALGLLEASSVGACSKRCELPKRFVAHPQALRAQSSQSHTHHNLQELQNCSQGMPMSAPCNTCERATPHAVASDWGPARMDAIAKIATQSDGKVTNEPRRPATSPPDKASGPSRTYPLRRMKEAQ